MEVLWKSKLLLVSEPSKKVYDKYLYKVHINGSGFLEVCGREVPMQQNEDELSDI